MNYIEYKEGKLYDPAHLRPFDLALAKQGHPLAWAINNCGVRYLAQNDTDERWFDFSHYEPNEQIWVNRQRNSSELQSNLRLAPLAVKDGKPLHYLDHVERFYQQNEYHHVRWDRTQVGDIGFGFWAKNPDKWRWPVGAQS